MTHSPFPAGLNQTLLFTATARGEDSSGQGPTTGVTATLTTNLGEETLSLTSTNQSATPSTWLTSRLVEPVLGDAKYDVPIEDGNAPQILDFGLALRFV